MWFLFGDAILCIIEGVSVSAWKVVAWGLPYG